MARVVLPTKTIPRKMARPEASGLLAILGALSLITACSDEGAGVGGVADEGDTAGEDASEDGDPADDGTLPDLPPEEDLGFEGVPAGGGIAIAAVEFNQGVGVQVTRDGAWLSADQRRAPLVQGREAVVRAFWTIPEDWEAREIEARLHLRTPAGEQRVRTFARVIDGPSNPDVLADGALGFVLSPEEMIGGMDFQITLWEVDETLPGGSEVVSAAPGWNPLGVELAPLELKVVIVPVRVSEATNGCNSDTSDVTDEQIQGFATWLRDFNPVQEVIIRKRDTYERVGAITSPSNLFPVLQALREEDEAEPNEYYYGLYDDCGASGGAAGAAPGAENVLPTKEAAPGRISAGRWYRNRPEAAYSVFVHEVGHTQSRPHSPCGGAANPDPAYPYPGARLGTHGLNTRTYDLYPPDAGRDYMSYCGPEWVSDYTWRKVFRQIRILTSWDYESRDELWAPRGHTLQGQLYPDGSQAWWTARGRFAAPPTGEDAIEIDTLAGDRLRLAASVRGSQDDEAVRYVTVDLPDELDGLADISGLVLEAGDERFSPDPGELLRELSH